MKYRVINRPVRDPLTREVVEPGGVVNVPRAWFDRFRKAGVLGEPIEESVAGPREHASIRHKGGGWYELPTGEVVRGKENAMRGDTNG